MKKPYEKAELKLNALLVYDLTNNNITSAPEFMDDENHPDDGEFNVG